MVLPLSGALRDWGRLLRVSLFATAAADPLVGVALAGGTPEPRLALAPLASLGVYHGAMVLNDLADRRLDAERGRARPLVEGRIAPGAAALAVLALFAGGLALAWAAGGGAGLAWLGAAAAVAVLYDLAGRGPWLGPALLALARGTNLLFGAACAGWVPAEGAWVPVVAAIGYGAYVLTVSRLGRMEDGDEGEDLGARPTSHLRVAAGLLLAVPVVVGAAAWLAEPLPRETALVAALAGAFVGLRLLSSSVRPLAGAASRDSWTPAAVEGVMGLALSRFLPLTLGCLLLARPEPWHLALAAGLLLLGRAGRALMATFPPS